MPSVKQTGASMKTNRESWKVLDRARIAETTAGVPAWILYLPHLCPPAADSRLARQSLEDIFKEGWNWTQCYSCCTSSTRYATSSKRMSGSNGWSTDATANA